MNILIHTFSLVLNIYLEVELLAHMVTLCLKFWGTTKLFYNMATPFYNLTSNVCGFQPLHLLINAFFFFFFLIIALLMNVKNHLPYWLLITAMILESKSSFFYVFGHSDLLLKKLQSSSPWWIYSDSYIRISLIITPNIYWTFALDQALLETYVISLDLHNYPVHTHRKNLTVITYYSKSCWTKHNYLKNLFIKPMFPVLLIFFR